MYVRKNHREQFLRVVNHKDKSKYVSSMKGWSRI